MEETQEEHFFSTQCVTSRKIPTHKYSVERMGE